MVTSDPDISLVSPWPAPPLSRLLQPCERPVILAGAGVGASCGLPTGANLAAWLRAQDFAAGVDFSEVDGWGRGDHPGYVAARILDSGSIPRLSLLGKVASHIRSAQQGATISRLARAVARTPTGLVLTLNYDTLVEDAARLNGRRVESHLPADVPELINDDRLRPGGVLRVVHLHGVATEPGSLVLDHHSYMRQANDTNVRELFAVVVARHSVCAIGTQFEEDYLGAVMLARRPSRPRHVIVCDVSLAERVRGERAGIGVERHNWRPCSYPDGEHRVLDPFCERLVTCEDLEPVGGPVVAVVSATPDTVYVPRLLLALDEAGEGSEGLQVDLRLELDLQEAHRESVLGREQLAVVVGPPGSGKTRLLQELARHPGPERALLLSLRDVRAVVGQPEELLRRWLERAGVLEGEPVAIESVLAGRIRVWLMLDGLDEVPRDRRDAVAAAVELLATAFPQHRFTVTSRPVASLAELTPPWRVFELVCDRSWQGEFLRANGIDEKRFREELELSGRAGESVLRVPFFLRGAVEALEADEPLVDAMQIALVLLDRALAADEQTSSLGGVARAWLGRVAVLQHLRGESSIGEADLEALAAEAGALGDLATLTDLLASRSLLVRSGDRWSFAHRIFGDALVATHLIDQSPGPWLDSVAPRVDGWSAVLEQWSAPLTMVLGRSADWRRAIGSRDPLFAARATPPDAPAAERRAAASLLWAEAVRWDVWIDPVGGGVRGATDAELVAALLRAGDLDALLAEIGESLHAPSRFARGNAVDVLAAVPVPDIAALLAEVLARDEDPVVRRSAASAALDLGLAELSEPIGRRAAEPEDTAEAADMAAAAIELTPPERRLGVARELAARGNDHVWDHGDLTDLPPADRVAWTLSRARSDPEPSLLLRRETARLVADVGETADPEVAEELGYLAALSRSHDREVLDFVASRDEAAAGVRQALDEETVHRWEIAPLLGAVPGEERPAIGVGGEAAPIVEAPRRVEPEPSGLTTILSLPVPERRRALAGRAGFSPRGWVETGEADRASLGSTLLAWWGEKDLRDGVARRGDAVDLDDWAATVLAFGPVARLSLGDERWVQAATCGWLFPEQREWLAAGASQGRLDLASAAAPGVRELADLLWIGAELDVGRIEARLAAAELRDEDNRDLARAGRTLAEVAGREGLLRLAAAGGRWAHLLRPRLARAGDVEAQIAELAELASGLRAAGERPADLSWLSSVSDPAVLPALEEVLVAAGEKDRSPASEVLRRTVGAIEVVGGVEAAKLLDRVARERRYPGAQFLVEHRDRVVQGLLWPQARAAAGRLGESLGLPGPAGAAGEPPRLHLAGKIGRRLREALEAVDFGGRATAVAARLEPLPTRGEPGEARTTMPMRVELGEEAVAMLGADARASALFGDGELRIWLSGLSSVPTGVEIRVTALGSGGDVVHAVAEVTHAPMQFDLPCPGGRPPAEIVLTVVGG